LLVYRDAVIIIVIGIIRDIFIFQSGVLGLYGVIIVPSFVSTHDIASIW
jgi:hypothetical protein